MPAQVTLNAKGPCRDRVHQNSAQNQTRCALDTQTHPGGFNCGYKQRRLNCRQGEGGLRSEQRVRARSGKAFPRPAHGECEAEGAAGRAEPPEGPPRPGAPQEPPRPRPAALGCLRNEAGCSDLPPRPCGEGQRGAGPAWGAPARGGSGSPRVAARRRHFAARRADMSRAVRGAAPPRLRPAPAAAEPGQLLSAAAAAETKRRVMNGTGPPGPSS